MGGSPSTRRGCLASSHFGTCRSTAASEKGAPARSCPVPAATAVSPSAGGAVAARGQRRQQRGERRRLLLTHILAAARSPSAGCCAPPRVPARPLRRAALPPRRAAPRRPAPPLPSSAPRSRLASPRLGWARLHPGGAPRHCRSSRPSLPSPRRRRGAHLLRGTRMPGALPAPSPARPAAGARRGTAGRAGSPRCRLCLET